MFVDFSFLTLHGLKMLLMCKYNQGPWGLFILKEISKVGQNDDSACTACPSDLLPGSFTVNSSKETSHSAFAYVVIFLTFLASEAEPIESLQIEIRFYLTLYLPLVSRHIKLIKIRQTLNDYIIAYIKLIILSVVIKSRKVIFDFIQF